jgi:hypothetical protein
MLPYQLEQGQRSGGTVIKKVACTLATGYMEFDFGEEYLGRWECELFSGHVYFPLIEGTVSR